MAHKTPRFNLGQQVKTNQLFLGAATGTEFYIAAVQCMQDGEFVFTLSQHYPPKEYPHYVNETQISEV